VKKIILVSMIALFVLGIAAQGFAAGAAEKIGTVDLSSLFDEYYKTKEYDAVLETKSKDFEKDAKDRVEKIREMQGKLAVVKEDQKATMEADIEKMKADLLEFDRQGKTTLSKERNEKIQEILLEIEKIVSGYAEKEGYTIILNDRVLIYGNKALDVTPQILTILNANEPKKK